MKKLFTRLVLLAIVFLIVVFVIIMNSRYNFKSRVKDGCGISIPSEIKVETIFAYGNHDGEIFEIASYKDGKLDSLKDDSKFSQYTYSKDALNAIIYNYINMLIKDENKEKVNEHFEELTNIKNRIYYLKEPRLIRILIIDSDNNKIYYLSSF